MKKPLAVLEDAIEAMPDVSEFWVVYAGNGKVSGVGRNVPFAASHRETILFVAPPVARTSVAKEDRDQFNAYGETVPRVRGNEYTLHVVLGRPAAYVVAGCQGDCLG